MFRRLKYRDLRRYIAENYIEPSEIAERRIEPPRMHKAAGRMPTYGMPAATAPMRACEDAVARDLSEQIRRLDESFASALLRLIDERGMTDAECYKRADVDRKHFSKIRSNPDYKPRKNTAIAFCLALRLDLDETRALLSKAGYALTHSSKADIIVEYFILHGIYDVAAVNEALYEFDQPLLRN